MEAAAAASPLVPAARRLSDPGVLGVHAATPIGLAGLRLDRVAAVRRGRTPGLAGQRVRGGLRAAPRAGPPGRGAARRPAAAGAPRAWPRHRPDEAAPQSL